MNDLPLALKWLNLEIENSDGKHPLLAEAVAANGAQAIDAGKPSADVLSFAGVVGGRVAATYKDEHDPNDWSGLFLAYVVRKARMVPPPAPLWPFNWANFGKQIAGPQVSDVLVFTMRDGKGKVTGGHVGLYVGEDADSYHVFGGNPGGEAGVARYPKASLRCARRPPYPEKPLNLRAVILETTGAVKQPDEALLSALGYG